METDNISNAFPTSVVDGEKAASADATTTFVTDANVVATSVSNPMYTPRSLYMSASDNFAQEVKTYLEKPQLLASGFLASTDTASAFTQFIFPQVYGTKAMWVEKTRGYFGIRMDLSFRLVVNASRFQQGRYMLLWKPFGGSVGDSTKNAAIMNGHVSTLVQRSQMPHAEIDINCDTEIQFDIPFSNMYNWCHVRSIAGTSAFNSLGAIQIYPYVPLSAVAGQLQCGYNLYVSAKNVELIGASVPQSGRFNVTRRGKNETNSEQESANMGPISSIMSRVSAASSILTQVPLISSYASTAGWMSDIIGNVASTFGYSRPVNLEHAQRMTKEIFPYFSNTDGPDNSFPMALSYKNELAPMTGISPTDLDEMDFSFLCTIPTFNRIVKWETNTTHPVGTLLDSWRVSPYGLGINTTTVNGALLNHYAPYQFVASRFKFWRGTMVYKFKIVKTEFHSGRISFSFSPLCFSQLAGAVQSFADLPYIHRQIIDLRIDNEIILKVPFVSDIPWRVVAAPTNNDATGFFALHVIDPLIAPDTVNQSVSIIVEACMGPDAEFAVPDEVLFNTPFYGAAPQMGAFDSIANVEPNACNQVNDTVGAMSTIDDSLINASLCIGEKITSFRKFMRRPTPFIFRSGTTSGSAIAVIPYMVTGLSQNGVANSEPAVLCDFYGTISSFYLYSRGSVRLKYVNANPLQSSVGYSPAGAAPLIPLYYEPKFFYRYYDAPVTASQPITYYNQINAIDEGDLTNIHLILKGDENQEIQIPHYHNFPLRNNFDHFGNVQHPYLTTNGPATLAATRLTIHRSMTFINGTTLDSVPTRVYRATADDCNMSYFLSIPPLALYSGSG